MSGEKKKLIELVNKLTEYARELLQDSREGGKNENPECDEYINKLQLEIVAQVVGL